VSVENIKGEGESLIGYVDVDHVIDAVRWHEPNQVTRKIACRIKERRPVAGTKHLLGKAQDQCRFSRSGGPEDRAMPTEHLIGNNDGIVERAAA